MQSTEYINRMRLNKFPDQLFKKGNEKDLLEFLNKFPAEYYAIRDKTNSGSKKFNFKATKEDVLKDCINMDLFAINVSSYNYRENQLLAGHIMITSSDEIYLVASVNKNFSVRDAKNNPNYNINTFLNDRKLKHVPGLSYIADYLIIHKLNDVVVEFAVYNIKLGTENENVIIYELRTNY